MSNKRDLKAYMRLDGSHRAIPATLIFRKKMPKFGRWIEVQAYECCNASTTTTTTTAEPLCYTYEAHGSIIARVALWYEDCDGEEHVVWIDGNEPYQFCAVRYSIGTPGTVELISEECIITTTTTTTIPG